MRVLLKSKRSQLALDIKRRGGLSMCKSTIIWGACTQLPRDIVSYGSHTFGGRLIWLTCSFVIINNRHELTKVVR